MNMKNKIIIYIVLVLIISICLITNNLAPLLLLIIIPVILIIIAGIMAISINKKEKIKYIVVLPEHYDDDACDKYIDDNMFDQDKEDKVVH